MRMALASLQCPLPILALKYDAHDVLLTTVGADCHVVRDVWCMCVGLAPGCTRVEIGRRVQSVFIPLSHCRDSVVHLLIIEC